MASFKVMLVFLVSVLLRANTTTLTTPYEIGPGGMTRDFVSSTVLSATDYHVFSLPVLAHASASGSATITSTNNLTGKTGGTYRSICLPNPFKRMGSGTGRTFFNVGSGGILEAVLINKANPTGAAGDLGFTDDCDNGSGSSVIDNTCSATGCSAIFIANGSTMPTWEGSQYLKYTLSKDPGAGYKAVLHLRLMSLDR